MLKNIFKPLLLSLLPALFFQACGDKDAAKKSYTITYDLNGGTGTEPAAQTFKVNGGAIDLNDGAGLTKKGFAFGGWAEKVDGQVPVVTPYTPASNVTLYAIWIPVYIVTYHINMGTGTLPAPQTYTQGGAGLTLNDGAGLNRAGYKFGGWAETAEGKTALAIPFKPVKDMTVYAIWNPVSYIVTYHPNGGTGITPAPQTYIQGGAGLSLHNGAGLTRTNFSFGGWAETEDGIIALVSPFKPAKDITVYAIWNAPATYTVTYNINGGIGNTPISQTYTQDGTALTLKEGTGFSRRDFTFGGWAEKPDGKTALTSPYTPSGNITVYAIWNAAAANYTVRYDINRGVGTTPVVQTYTGGTGLTLHDGTGLTRQGYTFGGWAEKPDGKTALVSPYRPSKNIIVYAIWNTTYTVTYNSNGGIGNTPTRQTFTQGGTALTLNNGEGLTRQGFTFSGWAETATGKTALPSPYSPSRNIIVYAIWNAAATTYTVTYNINGGSGNTPAAQTYSGGTGLTLNDGTGLTRQGFTFFGWSATLGGTTALTSPYTPTGNITVYAIWNAAATTYTVTYNINGGSGNTPAAQTYSGGTGLTLNDGTGLTRQGFTFFGWSATSGGTTALTSPYIPTVNITVYAIWNAAAATTYTVTYNINGGSGNTPAAQTYTQGGTALTLNDGTGLTRQGFTFLGWSATSGGTTALTSPYTPTVNITVYAIWDAAAATTYTVTYNINGGSGNTPAAQTYTQGGAALTLNDGTGLNRPGYTFRGWVTSATGTVALTGPYTPNANITLYAYWQQNVATALTLTSSAYTNGQTIPAKYGGDSGISPPLSWSGGPTTDVVKYILVFFDATVNQWHFRRAIDTNISSLAEGDIPKRTAPSFSPDLYFGPNPPNGETHTYEFKLYAVKTGYSIDNFCTAEQQSWAQLEAAAANAAFIAGSSNIYSGTYTGTN